MQTSRGIAEAIREIEELPLAEVSALDRLVPALPGLLVCDCALTYGVSRPHDRYSLEFDVVEGLSPDTGARLDRWLENAPARWGHYDPITPERWQRNRVLTLADLIAHEPGKTASPLVKSFAQFGLGGHDQLRALICDGPAMLAWVGGFRPRSFGVRERRALQQLVPALQTRLRLERELGMRKIHEGALAHALEAIAATAYLLDATGRVVLTNTLGRARMSASSKASRAGRLTADDIAGFDVVHIRAHGMPVHRLAVERHGDAPDAARSVSAAAQAWRLTPRQTEVLRLLARGWANKTIAAHLRCAVITVENHVTAILAKSGADSRAAVVAALRVFG